MGHPNGAWRCQYGTWHDLYEECTCSPAAVLATALPDHDRMVTALADARAARAGQAYHARITGENSYYAGLFGLVLTGRAAA